MSRRGKLGVALLLALSVHGLLVWRLPAAAPHRGPETAVDAEDAAIAVDWTAAPVAASPSRPPTQSTASGAAPRPSPAADRRDQSRPRTGTPGPAPRDYAERVRRHLSLFAVELPEAGQGEARVRFTVDPQGAVSAIELLRSSGDPQLDEAALALPEQATPLPSPGSQPLRLEVPVRAAGTP